MCMLIPEEIYMQPFAYAKVTNAFGKNSDYFRNEFIILN